MTTDLDLALRYIAKRFPLNERERLVAAEGVDGFVPYVVLARTSLGCVWRFREDVPSAVVRDVAKLAGREPGVKMPPTSAAPPERQEPILRLLNGAGLAAEVSRWALFARACGEDRGEQTPPNVVEVKTIDDLAGLSSLGGEVALLALNASFRKHGANLSEGEWREFADVIYFA